MKLNNLKKINYESYGTLLIAYGSIVIFISWVFHDVINPAYKDRKLDQQFNFSNLRNAELGGFVLAHYLTYLNTDSLKIKEYNREKLLAEFGANAERIDGFRLPIYNIGIDDDNKDLLEFLNGLFAANQKAAKDSSIRGLDSINAKLNCLHDLTFEKLDKNQYSNIQLNSKNEYESDLKYIFCYLCGSACFAWGFILRKLRAIIRCWKILFDMK